MGLTQLRDWQSGCRRAVRIFDISRALTLASRRRPLIGRHTAHCLLSSWSGGAADIGEVCTFRAGNLNRGCTTNYGRESATIITSSYFHNFISIQFFYVCVFWLRKMNRKINSNILTYLYFTCLSCRLRSILIIKFKFFKFY